jgi:hypothetical protein
MPIQAAVCESFKRELLALEPHRPGDVLRLALYTSAANLGPETEKYTTRGEVKAPGYKPGGVALPPAAQTLAGAGGGVVWPGATIRARGGLIYNFSRDNRAVAVVDFGQDVASTNDKFTVMLPPSPLITLL